MTSVCLGHPYSTLSSISPPPFFSSPAIPNLFITHARAKTDMYSNTATLERQSKETMSDEMLLQDASESDYLIRF